MEMEIHVISNLIIIVIKPHLIYAERKEENFQKIYFFRRMKKMKDAFVH